MAEGAGLGEDGDSVEVEPDARARGPADLPQAGDEATLGGVVHGVYLSRGPGSACVLQNAYAGVVEEASGRLNSRARDSIGGEDGC